MTAYECWLHQKEKLRASITEQTELSSAAYLVRHSLAQVEQTVLAAQQDDVLRQQSGVLFACLKNSTALMDTATGAKVWVAQSVASAAPKKKGASFFLLLAAAIQLAAGLLAYSKNELILWVPMLGALILAAIGVILLRKGKPKAAMPEDDIKITLHPDVDKLLRALDAQMQAMDRSLNDFAYLNESPGGKSAALDEQTVDCIADLLESIAELGDDSPAMDAAKRMLTGLGIEPVPYSEERRQLFTVLPSKSETATLAPALLSREDGRLLRRGTAIRLAE